MLTELIGQSHVVVALREEVGRLLQRPLGGRALPPILILGETGTGKGLLAAAIHREGPRAAGPFVAVNCAAIPETLLEAELFGFERGAFTDARQTKPGLVETAHGGTLFLDEIGLLPGGLQGKLLTVLEEGAVRRLGRTWSDPVDVTILTATSEDLRHAVREHRFSEALYHRVSVLTLRLPPLRERGADILLLAEHWLARAAADYGMPVKTLSPEARAALRAYAWPGNVRELRNLMERVTLTARPDLVTPDMLSLAADRPVDPRETVVADAPRLRERLGSMERETLVDVLNHTAWNITHAAARLGVPPTTLRYRLRKHGLLEGSSAALPRTSSPAGAVVSSSGPGFPAVLRAATGEATDERPPTLPGPRLIAAAGCRQLTVVVCGLTHSGGLSEDRDPGALHAMMRDARAACAEVIERFEGCVAPHPGDGLLVYFGLPRAHEDDPRRAVHAALGIVDAMRRLSDRLERERGVRVSARLGIHTDVVVLEDPGQGERGERVPAGETTPEVARQLHQRADADTVVISAATHRLIEGYFVCEDLGHHRASALTAPLPVYRVVRESAARGRLEAATQSFTPLVGRQQELGLLLERWEQAREGRGQVVLLSGEAGIGKSRLVRALDEHLAREAHARQSHHGSPYYRNTALYPVVDALQRQLLFERTDDARSRLSKLEAALREAGPVNVETLSLFAALLSLPGPEGHGPLMETPQRLKQKTLEAVLGWLLEDAERQVTLSVWEDLQWVDASTIELLDLVLEEVPTARLLLILTFRPEFAHPWPARSHVTHLALHRLPRGQAEVMVGNLAQGRTIAAPVVRQVVVRADGVPLFVEELTKMMLEFRPVPEASGALTEPAPPVAIPTTLRDWLMARLDRLGAGKEALQLAATLGHEFSYDMIHAVSSMDEPALRRELAELVGAELLYRKGNPPHARYTFKHALIQEAAYQSLLSSRRRAYHRRIAQVLEERLPAAPEIAPELLAHHYTEAGQAREAIAYWHRAAQRAMEHCATGEAIAHVRKGLALLETLPDTADHAGQELALQLTLGAALLTMKDYTSPDVEKVYARAHALRSRVRDDVQLFSALFGLWRFHISRAEVSRAHELGRECFALAQRRGDPAMRLQAHFALGASSLNLGEFASALTDLEKALALCDAPPEGLGFLSGTDPAVACQCYAARARWFLGYPDQALAATEQALDRAHRLSHPTTLAYAIHLALAVNISRREAHGVQKLADMAIALAAEHGFERWGAAGLMRRGWTLVQQGAVADGIAQIRQGLTVWGSQLGRSHFLALLAEVHGKAGEVDAGLLALDEALVIAQGRSERLYEAELHLIRGELLRQREAGSGGPRVSPGESPIAGGPASASRTWPGEPERCFREAISIARRQGAKSLELRAATSLSRLWQSEGKRADARQLLGEIHRWFTEGYETPDWRDAQAQLDTLR